VTLRSRYGGEVGFYYPFSRSYRSESTVSFFKQNENFDNFYYGGDLPFGQFFDGYAIPIRLSLVGETTRFMRTGPLMGHTFKFSFSKYIKAGSNFLDAYELEGDIRKYVRISNSSLLAFRAVGYKSGGPNALLYWTGGNNTIRSAEFLRLVGNNMFLFNAEFRFPIIQVALTPIGLIGPINGTFFFDFGGVWYNGQKFKVFKDKDEAGRSFQLEDAISSYGFGLEFFLFGYPMHVDWVWRTDWKQKSYQGATFWVGFDF
jgi:outer membrane protein assembly factor BamA